MKKRLDQAMRKVRTLPEVDQNDTAEMLLVPIDDETASAIEEGLADAGRGDFASVAEVAALWKSDTRRGRRVAGPHST